MKRSSAKKAPPGTVFWDFDGTLVARPRMWSGACLDALDEFIPGHTVTVEGLRKGISWGFPWHAPEQSYAHITEPSAWWAHLAAHFHVVLRDLGVQRDLGRITTRLRQHIIDASRYTVYDEVRPALESLADDGWSQVIVSNHVPELEEIVRDLGLRRYFTRVLSSALVGFEKPHPEIFRRALQVTLPGRPVWMIGDSERADCLPARDLGIQAILVRAASSDFALQAGDVLEAANIVRSGASS